jgi:hypothetical protein
MYIILYYITIISLLYVFYLLLYHLLYHSVLLYHSIISLLYHFYITFISLLNTIFSDYISVLHSNFQEPSDANSLPMRPVMNDRSPAASAKLLDDQTSLFYEAMSTYSAEPRLLYALFLVLYLLFQMSVEDSDVTSTYTLQAHIQQIFEVHHAIGSRRMLSLLSHGPYSCPFGLYYTHYFTIISLLFVYFKIRNGVWVCIHCIKLANQHIHHRGSVSIQTKSIRDSIINLQQSPLPCCQLPQPAHPDRSLRCTPAMSHAIQA